MGRQTSVHDEEWSGLPYIVSIVSDGLVQGERQHFTISGGWCKFPQISYTVLCDITVRLGSHTFCTRLILEMLTGAYRMQIMLALTLEWCHKDYDGFLNHSTPVTGQETGVCESWNKRVVKAMGEFTFTKQARKLKKCLPGTDRVCFLGQGRSADGWIHITRNHNNITSVLWNTK